MFEDVKDRRQGERRVSDPCIHERDWVRLEQTVERHDRELKALHTDGAETKVYMKQVLESQKEIKESIREIQDELRSRPSQPTAPMQVEVMPTATVAPPVQSAPVREDGWGPVIREITPTVVRFILILVAIIAVLVGADGIVTKAIGGTP